MSITKFQKKEMATTNKSQNGDHKWMSNKIYYETQASERYDVQQTGHVCVERQNWQKWRQRHIHQGLISNELIAKVLTAPATAAALTDMDTSLPAVWAQHEEKSHWSTIPTCCITTEIGKRTTAQIVPAIYSEAWPRRAWSQHRRYIQEW